MSKGSKSTLKGSGRKEEPISFQNFPTIIAIESEQYSSYDVPFRSFPRPPGT
jgi:hypothetical protein